MQAKAHVQSRQVGAWGGRNHLPSIVFLALVVLVFFQVLWLGVAVPADQDFCPLQHFEVAGVGWVCVVLAATPHRILMYCAPVLVYGHVQETAGGGDLNLQLFELPSGIEQLPSTDREAIGTFLEFPRPIAKRSVFF